ncbi:MAG TPA: hypothetical protein VGZ47_15455 [Gemmataceae bacterium]|jgi:hypothetical protein|nr:hypothetical protein [Gemmataceae bacterium]
MASPETPQDSIPPSLSHLRRHMPAGASPNQPAELADDTVDFENLAGDESVRQELAKAAGAQEFAKAAGAKPASDEIQALLERYQAEKSRQTPTDVQIDAAAAGLPPLTRASTVRRNGSSLSGQGDIKRAGGLPALTTSSQVELEKLRAENTELKKLLAEMQQFYSDNDPQAMVQHNQEVEQALTAKDAEIATLKQQIEEWNTKLQTHRLVPSEDEMAKMSDELEQERCQLAQQHKQLETERHDMTDDEQALMKQMREMEVGLAKDRAELARQRIELQRLHSEIKHELEQLNRGDAGMKERLAQFQRRHSEVFSRSSPPPTPASAPAPPPPAAEAPPAAKPRESTIRRFFRQG